MRTRSECRRHAGARRFRARIGLATAIGLAAAIAGGLSSAPAPAATVIGDCTIPGWAPQPDASLASAVVSLVNQYRASLGLGQLAVSSALTASAGWKASHMDVYGYFAHDDPAESGAWATPARTWDDRILTCGFPPISPGQLYAGENIAWNYATPQEAFNAWLASPEHRANIENATYTQTGVGVAGVYWVQDFGATSLSSLAASVRGLAARRTAHGVVVRWRTASETETAGFNVYRSWHGKRTRLTRRLVAASTSATGHAYRYVDRARTRAGARYWLQVVNLDGSFSWYGPARVAQRAS